MWVLPKEKTIASEQKHTMDMQGSSTVCCVLLYTTHTMHKHNSCPSPVPGITGTGSCNPQTKSLNFAGPGFKDQQLRDSKVITPSSLDAAYKLLTDGEDGDVQTPYAPRSHTRKFEHIISVLQTHYNRATTLQIRVLSLTPASTRTDPPWQQGWN